jgi:hypothetical protein
LLTLVKPKETKENAIDKLQSLLVGMEGMKSLVDNKQTTPIMQEPVKDIRDEPTPINNTESPSTESNKSPNEPSIADIPPKDVELYKYDVKEKVYYETPRKIQKSITDKKDKKYKDKDKDSRSGGVRKNYSKGPTIINHVSINIYSDSKSTDKTLANVLKNIESEGGDTSTQTTKQNELKRNNIQEPGQISEDKKHRGSPKLKRKRSPSRSRSRSYRRDKRKKTYRSRSRSEYRGRSRSRSKGRYKKRDRSSTSDFSSLGMIYC